MKVSQRLFVLLFALFAVVAVTVAQEGDAEAAVPEGAAEAVAMEVNCDEFCASQVAEATRVANQEKAELEAQLSPLKAALDQAKDASVVAASEVTNLKGQLANMESAVAAAKAEAAAIKASSVESEAATSSKLAAMEAELAAAKAKVEEFESARYIINKDVIKADVMGVLKKYGLVKDEEKEL